MLCTGVRMAKFHTISCSVLDTRVSQPLLLRSTSSKSSTCTCGSALHEQSVIELVPEKLFTFRPTKMLSFAEQITDSLSHSWTHVGHAGDRIPPFLCSPDVLLSANSKNGIWWKQLLDPNGLSPFQHIWDTVIRFADLFSCHSPNGLCYGVNFCHATSPCTAYSADCKSGPTCPCSGIRLMLGGLSSAQSDAVVSAWSPCSRTFALQLAMSWAKLLIEQDEESESVSGEVRSNLCRPSYGVLENWLDIILMNKLGPKASNSVQIEPDLPSFSEEHLCPIGVNNQSAVPVIRETVVSRSNATIPAAMDDQDRASPFTIILRDPKNSLDASALAAYPAAWHKLDRAWDRVIQQRLTTEPEASNTLVINLDEANGSVKSWLPGLVRRIGQFSRRFCRAAV